MGVQLRLSFFNRTFKCYLFFYTIQAIILTNFYILYCSEVALLHIVNVGILILNLSTMCSTWIGISKNALKERALTLFPAKQTLNIKKTSSRLGEHFIRQGNSVFNDGKMKITILNLPVKYNTKLYNHRLF